MLTHGNISVLLVRVVTHCHTETIDNAKVFKFLSIRLLRIRIQYPNVPLTSSELLLLSSDFSESGLSEFSDSTSSDSSKFGL